MTGRAPAPTRTLLYWWLGTRALALGITLAWFNGDTETYFGHGRALWEGRVPYREHAIEYPPAATLLFTLLGALAHTHAHYRLLFIAAALSTDALVFARLAKLGHAAARERAAWLAPASTAAPAYAVASALLYPVLLVRFDLFPAAALLLALPALGALEKAPRIGGDKAPSAPPTPASLRAAILAGAWLGLAIALKLYPLVFAPLLLGFAVVGRWAWSRAVVLAAVAAGVVVVTFVPFVAVGAGSTVFSFLRYQGERGIQVESTYGGWLLFLQHLLPFDVQHVRSHGAHDVVGPAAAVCSAVARVLHPLAVLGATAVALRRQLPLAAALAGILGAALVTTPVFSPQFLLWWLPLAALALGPGRAPPIALVSIALCTTLVFPYLYPALTAERFHASIPLVVRNGLVAWLTVRLLGRREPFASGGVAPAPEPLKVTDGAGR